MPFCIKCGTNLKPEWSTCPNCGQNLKFTVNAPQKNRQTNQIIYANRKYSYGRVALIFSILALFFFPFAIFLSLPVYFWSYWFYLYLGSFIFSTIAIILGKNGMKFDLNPSIAKKGYILGLVGLGSCIILFFIILASMSIGGCCVPEI